MDICKNEIRGNKKYIFPRIRASLKHIKRAMNLMDDIQFKLSYFIENEHKLTDMEREIFYSYGLEKSKIHLTRLSNVKKSLESILPPPPKK